jgi:hypothetical protein
MLETRVENFRASIEMLVFEKQQRKTNGPNYALYYWIKGAVRKKWHRLVGLIHGVPL